MIISCGDGFHARKPCRNICLSVGSAPNNDGSIAFQGHAECVPRCNRHGVRQVRRSVQLPVIIEPPTDHSSVAAQSKAVSPSGRYCDYIRSSWWNISLSGGIVAPGNHEAIAAKRQAVVVARRYRFYIGNTLIVWSVGLAETVVSPGHNSLLCLEKVQTQRDGGDQNEGAPATLLGKIMRGRQNPASQGYGPIMR